MTGSATDEPYGIHWFRRDLRVVGNPALTWNQERHQGRVLGLFAFDRTFLSRPDFSHNRFGLFLRTLELLRAELQSRGGDLLLLDVGPDDAFGRVFAAIDQAGVARPRAISFNRDYEPFARARDARVTKTLEHEHGIEVHTERDHLLIEPDELLQAFSRDSMYQVYSPFAKKWLEFFQTDAVQSRVDAERKALAQRTQTDSPAHRFHLTWQRLLGKHGLEDHLNDYIARNARLLTVDLPAAGPANGLERLHQFARSSLSHYGERRDIPSIDGTSKLSIFLKNGSLTTAQIIAEVKYGAVKFRDDDGATKFLKELIWREFYYHVLYHRPEVEQQAFLEQYRDIPWLNREDWFQKWKEGQTGYPIVDAGMRQLKRTGWMHNRVRMIVASFLTKDLLIDWRWGERYFMEQLLDGDLAPNNGGWQWAASTGCDPQPYFRIFNPELQSKKFDPEGDYIRTWVEELADVPAKFIHAPRQAGILTNYAQPIVDHATQKEQALALYRRDA